MDLLKSLKKNSLSDIPWNFSYGLLSFEQVKDYCTTLLDKNSSVMKTVEKELLCHEFHDKCLLNLILKSYSAEYITNLCDTWKLHDEVKFAAIEMFGKFHALLLSQIYETIYERPEKTLSLYNQGQSNQDTTVCNSKEQIIEKNNQWNQTLEHVAKQMELRAVSCIVIANKLDEHKQGPVNLSFAAKYLSEKGFNYNIDALIKSELRVLKTFQYNLGSMLLVMPHVGVLIDYLFHIDQTFSREDIYVLSTELLNCFYPRCVKFYAKYSLHENHSEVNLAKASDKMILVAHDIILLACGIVTSAVYLWSSTKSDLVIKILSSVTDVSQNRIVKFSYTLLEETLK